jgi:hypothetical protein
MRWGGCVRLSEYLYIRVELYIWSFNGVRELKINEYYKVSRMHVVVAVVYL